MEFQSAENQTLENETLALNKPYYGHKVNSPDGDMVYLDIFSHPMSTKVCSPKQIYELKFRSATNEELENEKLNKPQERIYWAFLDKKDMELSMIFPNQSLFNMCFAYGPDIEVKAGKGKILRLAIEETNEFSLSEAN